MLLRNTVYTLLLGSFSFSAMAEKACTNYDGYHFGNPSAEEQMHLELINRARANPKAEARLYGLSSVTEGVEDTSKMSTSAMQPLTFNYKLYKAAQGHSKDMADNEYFSHYSQGTNDSLFDRIKAQNYKYLTAGENLAYTATTGSIDKGESSIDLHSDLFIDDGYPGRGHRVNILNPKYKEVGVSLAFGIRKDRFNTYYVTDNFASYFDSRCHFITGVVYDDKDGDKFYSIGEGIKDVKITFENSDSTGKTYNAGGYGIPANDGTYQVTFTHTDLGSYTESITVNGQNIKVNVLASQFKSGSAGDTDTDPVPEPTTPEYAVSTYDVGTTQLTITAMAATGFIDMYDVTSVHAPTSTISTADLNTIKGKVELITQTTGSADNMTVFKLTGIKPVQTETRGATYTPPAMVEVHELNLTQGDTIVNKLEALFLYVEADGQGYLVLYGTKPIS